MTTSTTTSPVDDPTAHRSCGLMAVGLVLIVSVYLCGQMFAAIGEGQKLEPPPVTAFSLSNAYAISQSFVKDQLKAPSTAKFPEWDGNSAYSLHQECGQECSIAQTGADTATVVAYVGSDNSFGAMLRSHYVAVVTWVGGNQWRLDSLTFN